WVAAAGLVAGWVAFGIGPMATLSGTTLAVGPALLQIAAATGYVPIQLGGLAAIGVFFSTLTDSSIGAAGAALFIAIVSQLLDGATLGDVEVEEAIEAASVPHDFQLKLQQAQPGMPGLSFERDIKPLFGSSNRMSMKWAFDVWDYDDTVEDAQVIASMLEER